MNTSNSCSACRVEIGKNYLQQSIPRRAVGMALVYLPLLFLPFVIVSAYLTYFHLRLMGATNVKRWRDFIPARASHRYSLKNQITMDRSFRGSLAQSKLFWFLNCTWYCPYSVALFEWHSYMVKVVENWWCPFDHEKKANYANAMIDRSFWHLFPEESRKLHEDDFRNPIWNGAGDIPPVELEPPAPANPEPAKQ